MARNNAEKHRKPENQKRNTYKLYTDIQQVLNLPSLRCYAVYIGSYLWAFMNNISTALLTALLTALYTAMFTAILNALFTVLHYLLHYILQCLLPYLMHCLLYCTTYCPRAAEHCPIGQLPLTKLKFPAVLN